VSKRTHYETTGPQGRCNHKHKTLNTASACLRDDYDARCKRDPDGIVADNRYVVAVMDDGSIVDVNPPQEVTCATCDLTFEAPNAGIAWRKVRANGCVTFECSATCPCGAKATWRA
jgi:hypothetical protein